MKLVEIISAAQAESARFRKWLAWVLSWEAEVDADGDCKVEILNDGGGTTIAGLTTTFDGLDPDNLNAHWFVEQYKHNYWEPCLADSLPYPVGEVVANFAVNCGQRKAALFLQRALNDYGCKVTMDGVIGQVTCRAAFSLPMTKEVALAVISKGGRYYASIGIGSRARWLKGWLNRNASLRETFCS